MSRAPISRRSLMAGAGVTLAAMALPAGASAVAAEMPPAVDPGALPLVFDPCACCRDMIEAGYSIHARVPVWYGFDDDDRRSTYVISPPKGGGFGDGYRAVMARWADAIEACPDHVDEVVWYAAGQRGDAT